MGDERGKMENDSFSYLRERMVEEQLEARSITDPRVLAAFRRVPRHQFVPPDQIYHAYDDRPLPIPLGQTISQPFMIALMLQLAEFSGSETVLDVGAGSGYQAALMAELAKEVIAIERLPLLAESARTVLSELGYTNISVVVGDGSEGCPTAAPFDRILAAASSPRIPPALIEQLAANGRLLIPVGYNADQTLTLVTKDAAGRPSTFDHGWCSFVPLIGAQAWPSASD